MSQAKTRHARLEREPEPRLYRLEVALLSRQLATMLGAGLGLQDSLMALSRAAASEEVSVCLERLVLAIRTGNPLSVALQQFPRSFGNLYQAMVEVGEQTGSLVRVLDSLSTWLEREDATLRRTRAALVYPCSVLVVATLLTVGFFTLIFPSFAETLSSVGELPPLTVVLILVSRALSSPLFWLTVLGAGPFAARGLLIACQRPAGQLKAWKMMSRIPPLGAFLRELGASRFCASMTILLQSGIDILKSFRLACLVSGSPLILSKMEEGLQHLTEGRDLAEFMSLHREAFPLMVSAMVAAGQESGRMPLVFDRLHITLAEDTERRLELLTSLLEPLLTAFVAVLVGLLAVGLAMPMYTLINNVSP